MTATVINAAPFNANFNATAVAVNSVDNTNIGAAGLFASNLIPTTAGNATFGGITAGVGYKFLASATTSVPLTVSAIAGQSVDIFDITLTSGGTNAFKIASAGAATFGFALTAASLASTGAITAGNALTVTTGNLQVSAGSTLAIAGTAAATALGALSSPGSSNNGDGIFQRTASGGAANLGGATSWGLFDYGLSVAAEFNLSKIGAAAAHLTLANSGTLKTGSSTYAATAATVVGGNLNSTGAGSFSTPVGTGGNTFASGDIGGQRGVSTGEIWLGGSTTSYSWDGGINSAGNMSFCKSGAPLGNFNGTTGVYTATSDAKFKDNVAAIADAQAAIMALKPSGFTWKASGAQDFGFIAQEVQAIFPDAVILLNDERVKDGEDPILGINYQVIVAQLVAAFQSYVAAHP